MAGIMQSLPGFRDFFPAECARRNYLTGTWRRVARSFGFREYDGPTLEPLDLYRKRTAGVKSSGSSSPSPTKANARSPCDRK